MRQLNIFDMIQDVPPKVGDIIQDKELQRGEVTSIRNGYVKAKFKDKTTLTPERAFKYFFKVVSNG